MTPEEYPAAAAEARRRPPMGFDEVAAVYAGRHDVARELAGRLTAAGGSVRSIASVDSLDSVDALDGSGMGRPYRGGRRRAMRP